jgi:hypothetical protein
MAAAKVKGNASTFMAKSRSKRPGVIAKKKSSNLKTSKNYVKKYRGQGR